MTKLISNPLVFHKSTNAMVRGIELAFLLIWSLLGLKCISFQRSNLLRQRIATCVYTKLAPMLMTTASVAQLAGHWLNPFPPRGSPLTSKIVSR